MDYMVTSKHHVAYVYEQAYNNDNLLGARLDSIHLNENTVVPAVPRIEIDKSTGCKHQQDPLYKLYERIMASFQLFFVFFPMCIVCGYLVTVVVGYPQLF